jgi:hypothetical protein
MPGGEVVKLDSINLGKTRLNSARTGLRRGQTGQSEERCYQDKCNSEISGHPHFVASVRSG